MKTSVLVGILITLALPPLQAAQPFTVVLPSRFTGPKIASDGPMQSFLYSCPSGEAGAEAYLQVAVLTTPPGEHLGTLDEALDGMIAPVVRHQTGVKKGEYVKGTLGSLESLYVDYEADVGGHVLKGRIICAVSGRTLFLVHFREIATAWEKTWPSVEKALQTFTSSK